MENKPKPIYSLNIEDHLDTINREIAKRRARWKLDETVLFMSYEDVSQKIRLHIFKKWPKYDGIRPVANWANSIITNQIKNMVRDVYGSAQCICIQCPHNIGGNRCDAFGTQKNLNCSDFSKWNQGKRYKHEISFASSSDAPLPGDENNNLKRELVGRTCNFLDFDLKIPEFNSLLQTRLKPLDWKTYLLLFVENKTDIQTAKELGYNVDGGKDSRGVKAVAKIKTRIYAMAKEVVGMIDF